jgi:cysteine desulfuration protein SufE
MENDFNSNLNLIKKKFHSMKTPDEKYAYLIELGRELKPYPQDQMTPEKIVRGCQSTLYLNTRLENGKLFFEGSSDALISKGLAALLITIYSGLSPEEILLNSEPFAQPLKRTCQHLHQDEA